MPYKYGSEHYCSLATMTDSTVLESAVTPSDTTFCDYPNPDGYTEPFHGCSGTAKNADTPSCHNISGTDTSVSTPWNFIRITTQSQPLNGSLSYFLHIN